MQDAEASGVGTDVDQILRFININGFYVIGSKPVFPGVMYKLAGLRVVKVQAAIIGAYPKFFMLVFLDTSDDVAVQRICFGDGTDVLETVLERMVIV